MYEFHTGAFIYDPQHAGYIKFNPFTKDSGVLRQMVPQLPKYYPRMFYRNFNSGFGLGRILRIRTHMPIPFKRQFWDDYFAGLKIDKNDAAKLCDGVGIRKDIVAKYYNRWILRQGMAEYNDTNRWETYVNELGTKYIPKMHNNIMIRMKRKVPRERGVSGIF